MQSRGKIFCWIGIFSYILIVLGFPIFSIYRSYGIWLIVSRLTGRSDPIFWSILHQDAIVVGSVLLLLYLGFFNPLFKRLRPFAYVFRIGVVFIVLAYTVDVWLTLNFFKRLYYRDVLKYGQELKTGFNLLLGFFANWPDWISPKPLVLLMALLLFVLVLAFLRLQFGQPCSKLYARTLLVLGSCLVLTGLIPFERIHRTGAAYQNLFSYNMPKGVESPYSNTFVHALAQRTPRELRQVFGLEARPDIIVLIVESLSSSHSRYFSGINDYTPNLDEIAQKNLSLINFYANGPATEQGLIALLLGEVPLPTVETGGSDVFREFYRKKSIAAIMNRAGYATHYLTTGDLSFTNKQGWLDHIGFQVIEGDKTPFYSGWPRYHFNAAPDRALYDYALNKIQLLEAAGRHYFIVMETVSSHLPYIDPEGRSNSEKAVFTYVDRELGRFYQKLLKADFFRDGILIIVGDHRVMAPLSKAEYDRFGESAFARIPLVIATGGEKSGRIEDPFQQTDLFSSLEWLVSKEFRIDEWHGNFLQKPPSPPTCILTPETNDPDMVYVRCAESEGYIKLNGDKTRLVKGRIDPPVLSRLIDHINLSRIGLGR